jgi:hypothetical protein
VNDGGDIVMIRHLPVLRCTPALLCQICVRFKVSGYKNQNKESTLGLLKTQVMQEGLKNKMYDDDSASYFSVLSQEQGSTTLQETNLSVKKTDERPSLSSGVSLDTRNGGDNDKDEVPLREEDKVVSSDDADDQSSCSLTHTATHEDERAPSCSTSTTSKATSGSTTSSTTKDADNNQMKKKENGSSAIATKRRGKKKSKGTAPDVVTCINTLLLCHQCVHEPEELLYCDGPWSPADQGYFGQSYESTPSRVRCVAQPIP